MFSICCSIKVAGKLEETSDKLKETNSEIDGARKQAKKMIDAFERSRSSVVMPSMIALTLLQMRLTKFIK